MYLPSPQKLPHSEAQQLVLRWLDEYAEATPGTAARVSTTLPLGPHSEPEPAACPCIRPEHGGRVFVDDEDFLHGAPELIVEVSSATESIELNRKKLDYQMAGVPE